MLLAEGREVHLVDQHLQEEKERKRGREPLEQPVLAAVDREHRGGDCQRGKGPPACPVEEVGQDLGNVAGECEPRRVVPIELYGSNDDRTDSEDTCRGERSSTIQQRGHAVAFYAAQFRLNPT